MLKTTTAMQVDLIVRLEMSPRVPQSWLSERRLESEAADAVLGTLRKERHYRVVSVTPLESQFREQLVHEWGEDKGIEVQCGPAHTVTIFPDGSWLHAQTHGADFASLVDFVALWRRINDGSSADR